MRVYWLISPAIVGGVFLSSQDSEVIQGDKMVKGDFGQVEFVACCKVGETEIKCWDEKGKPVTKYEEKIRASFDDTYRSVPIRYGKKTRVAIFRMTSQNRTDGYGATLNGSFDSQYGSFYFNESEQELINGNRVRVVTAIVVADQKETTGAAKTSVNYTLEPSDKLELKPGSSVTYAGTTYTVRRIVKSTLDPTVYGDQGTGRWGVAITTDTANRRANYISWSAHDQDGLGVRAVDKDGTPVFVDEETLNRIRGRGYPGNSGPTPPTIFESKFNAGYPASPRTDEYMIYTNIDPSKISYIRAYGSRTTPVVITGIPLDPPRK